MFWWRFRFRWIYSFTDLIVSRYWNFKSFVTLAVCIVVLLVQLVKRFYMNLILSLFFHWSCKVSIWRLVSSKFKMLAITGRWVYWARNCSAEIYTWNIRRVFFYGLLASWYWCCWSCAIFRLFAFSLLCQIYCDHQLKQLSTKIPLFCLFYKPSLCWFYY